MARPINWEGDRKYRLPAEPARPMRRPVPLHSVKYVAAMSGPVRSLSPLEREAIEAERARKRQRELDQYGAHMTRLYGAPEDCHLTPRDCDRLRQSCLASGNVPPTWIALASDAYRRTLQRSA